MQDKPMVQRISYFADKMLLFVVTAFFGIAIAGYFSRHTPTILLVGLTTALSVVSLIKLNQARKKSAIVSKNLKEVLLQFYLAPQDVNRSAIAEALSSRYTVENSGDYMLINGTAVYTYLNPAPLKFDEFCSIYAHRPHWAKKLIFLTAAGLTPETSRSVAAIALPTPVTFFSPEQLYILLQQLDALPQIVIPFKKNQRSLKEFLSHALSPRIARRYLLTALLLIGSSFFMPSSIYFMIIGSACIVLAILAKMDIAARFK